MNRGSWFHHGPSRRGSPPEPPSGAAPPRNATRQPGRSRAAIEADLRDIPTLRAGICTGDVCTDRLFGELITRRADRLLDELLRSGNCAEGETGESAAVTSSSAGSGTTSSSSAAVPVTETAAELRSSPPSIHLAPGIYTLTTRNTGHRTHLLELRGPGVDGQTSGTVGPEGSTTLTVTLQPGTYRMRCPADHDRGAGMQTTLRVG